MNEIRRRTFVLISVILIFIYAFASAIYASYPASGEWLDAEPEGELLFGETFGTESWDGTAVYSNVFDGDPETYYDASTGGRFVTWVGIKLDAPAMLTEFRWKPRTSWTARSVGACIQGSNDGYSWTTIYTIQKEPQNEYTSVTSDDFETNAYFTMFRYTQSTDTHLDLAELEFYGKYEDENSADDENDYDITDSDIIPEDVLMAQLNQIFVTVVLISAVVLTAGNIFLRICLKGKKK